MKVKREKGESPPGGEKKSMKERNVSVLVGVLVCVKSHELDVFKAGRGAVAEWVGTMGVFAESMTAILA